MFTTQAWPDLFIAQGVLPVAGLCALWAGGSIHQGTDEPWYLLFARTGPGFLAISAMVVGDVVRRHRARAESTR
jgi:hypothetical protein